jgi:predicted short-subunit dehydrogenase-like oxidoreductase (DUF2520 family)
MTQTPKHTSDYPLKSVIRSVGVVGAGALGKAFIQAFQQIQIAQISTYTSKTAEELSKEFGLAAQALPSSIQVLPISELRSARSLPDWIFLTVPDQVIRQMSDELKLNPHITWPNHCVLHCSGALSSDVLSDLASKGAQTASIHPLQTFSIPHNPNPFPFKEVPFSIEGSTSVHEDLTNLIKNGLKGEPFFVTRTQKTKLHLAAALVSNGMVPLLASAKTILEDSGLNKGVERLRKLSQTTFENAQKWGEEALSGPIKRGDVSTIHLHLDQLTEHPEIQYQYALSGLQILSLLPLQLQSESAYQEMKTRFLEILSKYQRS